MELLSSIGLILLVLWGIGLIFRIGGKILKFLLIIGAIMLLLGYIS